LHVINNKRNIYVFKVQLYALPLFSPMKYMET
jgi:hypothetical protein